ncbi:MAG: metal ABC transporter substrate-binding protein [Lachnospiraceae bacterium]|nr:metal ABC transporter substrate-binding protein [Lachnospiraceae bacterium]
MKKEWTKKLVATLATLTLAASLVACGAKADSTKTVQDDAPAKEATTAAAEEQPAAAAEEETQEIRTLHVIASLVPHQELLEFIAPKLLERGIVLEIDGDGEDGTYNEKTSVGEIDFNFVQHQPYLDSIIEANGWDNLKNVGDIHIEPITAYSDKYASVEEVQKGDVVAIPNNGTNEYRALKILANNGFIKLDATADAELSASVDDIVENTYELEIVELDAAQIIPTKDDYDFFITNTNRALEAGLTSNKLFAEDENSVYANIITTSEDKVNDPAILAVVELLLSDETRAFINEHYNGAVIPAALDGSSSPDSPSDAYPSFITDKQ